jgi:hypothetical protein
MRLQGVEVRLKPCKTTAFSTTTMVKGIFLPCNWKVSAKQASSYLMPWLQVDKLHRVSDAILWNKFNQNPNRLLAKSRNPGGLRGPMYTSWQKRGAQLPLSRQLRSGGRQTQSWGLDTGRAGQIRHKLSQEARIMNPAEVQGSRNNQPAGVRGREEVMARLE